MPRAMWSGAISFGLVNVPIKMYTAARSQDVRFNQLHEPDMSRIRIKRFCIEEDTEVPPEEIVRGYEVSPDSYVTVSDEEMDALAPTVTSGIEIEEFVDLSEIDPVFFENSYYLVPDKGGAKAYALLRAAMRDANKIALGRVVLRSKQYLVALRPAGKALSLSTLYYPDEVVAQDELDGLPGEDVKASERELTMAQQLIEALSNEFEPDKYHDEYREQLLALIDEKASGAKVVRLPEKPSAPPVKDLMSALEASIAAAKKAKAS
jgi:DNA end-binding protein Ku